MTTDYDPIAEQYQLSKLQPWRTYLECHTLLELVGDPTGLTVLDVACGEGFYSRLIRRRGAAAVTGVDLSQGMIALAQQQEDQHPLGIRYVQGDARDPGTLPAHDLAVAAYLLNYSQTEEELQAMCSGVARALKPGGRFVTVNCNPGLDFPTAPSYRPFGFETSVRGPWGPGAPITWTFYLDESTFEIENYHLSIPAHESALRNAGFREIRWHAPRLSPSAVPGPEGEFWTPFLTAPPVTFLECIKG